MIFALFKTGCSCVELHQIDIYLHVNVSVLCSLFVFSTCYYFERNKMYPVLSNAHSCLTQFSRLSLTSIISDPQSHGVFVNSTRFSKVFFSHSQSTLMQIPSSQEYYEYRHECVEDCIFL